MPHILNKTSKTIFLSLAIDVEEEGLFAGKYQCQQTTCNNLKYLPKALEPFLALGIKPTLFCSYASLLHESSKEILLNLAKQGAEIAAHLHYWNTPPLPENCPDYLTSVPAASLAPNLLKAKLITLLTALKDISQKEILSFRMGRWDAHYYLWPILTELQIKVDSSIRPLHGKECRNLQASENAGLKIRPDHWLAPNYPYKIKTNSGTLLEIPQNFTSLLPYIRQVLPYLPTSWQNWIKANFHKFGALGILPIYHPSCLLKLTTASYLRSKRPLINLTWHSSEMLANYTPHLKTEQKVKHFLQKSLDLVQWLKTKGKLEFLTFAQLAEIFADAKEAEQIQIEQSQIDKELDQADWY